MVLLTITPTILETLNELQHLEQPSGDRELNSKRSGEGLTSGNQDNGNEVDVREEVAIFQKSREEIAEVETSRTKEVCKLESTIPLLSDPKLGNPISHGQVINLWKDLKARSSHPRTLDSLLRGSRVYNPPPKPKPEPTSEYKALMARLRHEEEERTYHRMTNPPPPMETFAQRFPLSSAAHAFASSYQPINSSDPDDDGVTYADVDRQMALVFNVLLSILACAGAIWVVARWWDTPARLVLSLGGSLLVGVAEVVVYLGYIRRVSEAKQKEKGVREVREVVKTWVVGPGDEANGEEADEKSVSIEGKEADNYKARRRKKEAK